MKSYDKESLDEKTVNRIGQYLNEKGDDLKIENVEKSSPQVFKIFFIKLNLYFFFILIILLKMKKKKIIKLIIYNNKLIRLNQCFFG